ncbi:unnamed protein product [Owenia fusiformis]|uniref:Peptidase M14 domain-containing protein n=1 Tax=Owenia fusiformis TaxID=6347 RepID=A0A8S4PBM3_OWEFU|nr:unnamed protein product [Owenia fusiformis]
MVFKRAFILVSFLTLFEKPYEIAALSANVQLCRTAGKEITALQDINSVVNKLKIFAGNKIRDAKKEGNSADPLQHLILDVISDIPNECVLKEHLTYLSEKLDDLSIYDLVMNIAILQSTVVQISEINDQSRDSTIMKSIRNRQTYISYDDMVDIMKDLTEEYPSQMSMYSIGKSGEGREIWVMAVSANKPDEHVLLRPELKYVGGIHGNEPVGGQLLIRFLAHLGQNFGKDDIITALMNTSRLHILPMLNPDGYSMAYGKYPAGGDSVLVCLGDEGRHSTKPAVDLNRNFGPDYFKKKYNPKPANETLAVKKWLKDFPFVMSLSFHGGYLVASYPYDNKRIRKKKSGGTYKYSKSPDDDIFKQMALTYSYSHGRMYAGKYMTSLFCTKNFVDGITNGAEWYYIQGGMQDYNYVNYGITAITIEMECCKFPKYSMMDHLWHENLASLINSWKFINKGIKGIISDSKGNPVPNAKVYINKRKHPFTSTAEGEYWRILLPGTFTIRVKADGYNDFEQEILVGDSILSEATTVNITLVSLEVATLTELDVESCFKTEKEIKALQDINTVINKFKTATGIVLKEFITKDKDASESEAFLKLADSGKQIILNLIKVYPANCSLRSHFTTLYCLFDDLMKNVTHQRLEDTVLNIEILQSTLSEITEIKGIMKNLTEKYPSQMSMYSIGKSGEGREIWVMAVSANKPDEHVLLRPELKYVGGIHGNEPVGGQLLIRFLAHLGQNFGKDDTITALMNSSRLHILPMLNPDGYSMAHENNSRGGITKDICRGKYGRYTTEPKILDLNRNFGPEFFKKHYNPKPAKETFAVKKWLEDFPFVMSLSFHGGALVASYPYDNKRTRKCDRVEDKKMYHYNKSPDDDIFRKMALTYSYNHGQMYAGRMLRNLSCGSTFIDGITNGADWFYIGGGMQDYNYVNHGILAITIEMDCCKYPPYSTMNKLWHENLASLIESWKFINRGIKGIISDSKGNPVPNAEVYIDKRKHPFTSTAKGEYWRILLPGKYNIKVKAAGYSELKQKIVVDDSASLSEASTVNINLV